jgi:hypothetical protein
MQSRLSATTPRRKAYAPQWYLPEMMDISEPFSPVLVARTTRDFSSFQVAEILS